MIKRLCTVLFLATLAACGSGGGSDHPSVTDVTVGNLYYGVKAQFDVKGSNLVTLNGDITATIPNCTGLRTIFQSQVGGEQAFDCTVATVGDITFQIKDKNGAVLYTKTVTVPPPQLKLSTILGDVVVELNQRAAPKTVDNFLLYADSGLYKNTIFHRVIAGFVVQGGGFTSGLTPLSFLYAPIALESNNGLSNQRGTIAAARTSVPDSATSQFFFNLTDNTALDYHSASDPGYAVFGKVISGMDVIDAIGSLPTTTVNGVADVPVNDVVLTSVTRLQ